MHPTNMKQPNSRISIVQNPSVVSVSATTNTSEPLPTTSASSLPTTSEAANSFESRQKEEEGRRFAEAEQQRQQSEPSAPTIDNIPPTYGSLFPQLPK